MSTAEKKVLGATLARATGQQNYSAIYKFLRCVQRPFSAICFRIEQACSRIETERELNRWNGKR